MSTLVLHLVGVTQGWHGGGGRSNTRRTAAWPSAGFGWPTRTGVTGLLASVEGRPWGSDVSDLDLPMLGRVDQPG